MEVYVKNTKEGYGSVSKLIHWSFAIVFGYTFFLAKMMEDMPRGPELFETIGLHKSMGIMVLAFACARIIWVSFNEKPEASQKVNENVKMAGELMVKALYLLMFLIPITGWLMSDAKGYPVSVFGYFDMVSIVGKDKEMADIFEAIHKLTGNAVLVLVGIHAAASLYHHFIVKDNVLKRMLPFSK